MILTRIPIKNLKHIIIFALGLMIVLISCNKKDGFIQDPTKASIKVETTNPVIDSRYDIEVVQSVLNLPVIAFSYTSSGIPSGLESLDNTPYGNPLTDQGATLGRVLFYDPTLSSNSTISCGSCHIQSKGFADNKRFNQGLNGELLKRNTPSLINLRFQGSFFWDTRESLLEEQVLMPVLDHVEMGYSDMDEVVAKLKTREYYPLLFKAAFGTEEITAERISKALAQFLRAMNSFESKFDEGLNAAGAMFYDFPNFTGTENQGKKLFRSHCASCHREPLFNTSNNYYWDNGDPTGFNIGLEVEYADKGIYWVTNDSFDLGKFKQPSLRNVALTAPYMHDGSLNTLESVINHYSDSLEDHKFLSSTLSSGSGPNNMEFSEMEKYALVEFLKTLTDEEFLTDEKFSNPFRKSLPN